MNEYVINDLTYQVKGQVKCKNSKDQFHFTVLSGQGPDAWLLEEQAPALKDWADRLVQALEISSDPLLLTRGR